VVDLTIAVEEPAELQELAAQVLETFEQRLNEDELASIAVIGQEVGDVADDEEADVLVAPDSYEAMTDFLLAVSRPGLILDGQHRVFGAKDVNAFDVQLPVVVMPGLAMAEQVFHFYVLNNKVRPPKPVELRRTISTALTLGEIDTL
jgi:hypothetical protein